MICDLTIQHRKLVGLRWFSEYSEDGLTENWVYEAEKPREDEKGEKILVRNKVD